MAYRWVENLRCKTALWIGLVLGAEVVQVRVPSTTLLRASNSNVDAASGTNNLIVRQDAAKRFQVYGNSSSDYLLQLTNIGGGKYSLEIQGDVSVSGIVTLSALPTSDPGVAGRLWNSGGTVMVSSGT